MSSSEEQRDIRGDRTEVADLNRYLGTGERGNHEVSVRVTTDVHTWRVDELRDIVALAHSLVPLAEPALTERLATKHHLRRVGATGAYSLDGPQEFLFAH